MAVTATTRPARVRVALGQLGWGYLAARAAGNSSRATLYASVFAQVYNANHGQLAIDFAGYGLDIPGSHLSTAGAFTPELPEAVVKLLLWNFGGDPAFDAVLAAAEPIPSNDGGVQRWAHELMTAAAGSATAGALGELSVRLPADASKAELMGAVDAYIEDRPLQTPGTSPSRPRIISPAPSTPSRGPAPTYLYILAGGGALIAGLGAYWWWRTRKKAA